MVWTSAFANERINFNDRGDSNLDWRSDTRTYTGDAFSVTLSGWTHTRNYHRGYFRNTGGDGKAVVTGLAAGKLYKWAVYQFCQHHVSIAPAHALLLL